MSEFRADQRKRTFKAGTIAFNRAGGITAIIKNLSDSGAMLQVDSIIGIPDEFTLVIEADALKRHCRVIWRQQHRLGVRFV